MRHFPVQRCAGLVLFALATAATPYRLPGETGGGHALAQTSGSPAGGQLNVAPNSSQNPPPGSSPNSSQNSGPTPAEKFFGGISQWLDEALASIGSGFKGAKTGIESLNKETSDAAKEAADAMARLPNTRLVRGHENCRQASNGAPDCVEAANKLCKTNGHHFGKSVDTTAAEECPAAVMLGRRAATPGECRTVTFVTSALCQ